MDCGKEAVRSPRKPSTPARLAAALALALAAAAAGVFAPRLLSRRGDNPGGVDVRWPVVSSDLADSLRWPPPSPEDSLLWVIPDDLTLGGLDELLRAPDADRVPRSFRDGFWGNPVLRGDWADYASSGDAARLQRALRRTADLSDLVRRCRQDSMFGERLAAMLKRPGGRPAGFDGPPFAAVARSGALSEGTTNSARGPEAANAAPAGPAPGFGLAGRNDGTESSASGGRRTGLGGGRFADRSDDQGPSAKGWAAAGAGGWLPVADPGGIHAPFENPRKNLGKSDKSRPTGKPAVAPDASAPKRGDELPDWELGGVQRTFTPAQETPQQGSSRRRRCQTTAEYNSAVALRGGGYSVDEDPRPICGPGDAPDAGDAP